MRILSLEIRPRRAPVRCMKTARFNEPPKLRWIETLDHKLGYKGVHGFKGFRGFRGRGRILW